MSGNRNTLTLLIRLRHYKTAIIFILFIILVITCCTKKIILVKGKVTDENGQHIKTLVNEMHSSGYYSASWDGTNSNGNLVKDDTYILTIYTGETMRSQKITFMKF